MKFLNNTPYATLFAPLIMLLFHPAFAQTSITGEILDINGNPLPYTNVILLQSSDSSFVKGTVSDIDGKFEIKIIKKGDYMLQTQMIGYESSYKQLSATGQNKISGLSITMKEETMQLDEVMVKAKKLLYEKKADRTVVNVQSRVTAASKSVLEVLSKSPGVIVNHHNYSISMFGKNGVGIMINGKLNQLPIEAVVELLNGMNAANVEKIELITSPPAKYDAEGVGGLINIVTKENTDLGTNGNLGLTAGYNKDKTFAGNFNLNHRTHKLNYLVEYSIRSDDNRQHWLEERTLFGNDFNQTIGIKSRRDFNLTEQTVRLGFSYNLSNKTTVNILTTGHKRNWKMDANTLNLNLAAPDSTIITNMDLYESNIWKDGMIGLGIEHQFNEQQLLELHLDYVYYENDNPSTYDLNTQINGTSEVENKLGVTKDTPLNFKVTKVDYSNQLNEKFRLQMGAKASLSGLNNDVVVSNLQADQWMVDERFTSYAELEENVLAGYVSLNWKATDHINIYGGLRYEFTDTYLSEGNVKGLVDREYGNFFPNVTLAQKLGKESIINLAYSSRITRPTFNEIAPFVLFSGPNTFFAGNPALLPAITDGFDLSYQFKSWWVSVKFNTTDNNIQRFQPETDPETGEQIYRSQNMDYFKIWNFSSSLPIIINSWWEIQNDVTLNYQSFKTNTNMTGDGFNWNGSSNHTFSLPKDFILEISGNYFSEGFNGIWKNEPFGQVDLGVKKSFNNSSLTLSFIDVFDTYRPFKFKGPILDGQGVSNFDLDLNVQSINLTFTMHFGNNKLKKVNFESGSEDERKRVQ